jgi:hypothetical protein
MACATGKTEEGGKEQDTLKPDELENIAKLADAADFKIAPNCAHFGPRR